MALKYTIICRHLLRKFTWKSCLPTRINCPLLCARRNFSRKLHKKSASHSAYFRPRSAREREKPESWLCTICLIIAIKFIIRNFYSLFMPWKYQTINDFFFIFLAAHKFVLFRFLPRRTTRRVLLKAGDEARFVCGRRAVTVRHFLFIWCSSQRKSLISWINFSSDDVAGIPAWETRQSLRANLSGGFEKFMPLIANSSKDFVFYLGAGWLERTTVLSVFNGISSCTTARNYF